MGPLDTEFKGGKCNREVAKARHAAADHWKVSVKVRKICFQQPELLLHGKLRQQQSPVGNLGCQGLPHPVVTEGVKVTATPAVASCKRRW